MPNGLRLDPRVESTRVVEWEHVEQECFVEEAVIDIDCIEELGCRIAEEVGHMAVQLVDRTAVVLEVHCMVGYHTAVELTALAIVLVGCIDLVQEVIVQERVRIDSVVVDVEVGTVDTVLEVDIVAADSLERASQAALGGKLTHMWWLTYIIYFILTPHEAGAVERGKTGLVSQEYVVPSGNSSG
ncbi:hypothetical protein M7I_1315 [Glarea lozoyensis 74030]|uniref:Uncharacterized protein n=1 Tax=Glarea lozoyensis (strain ATCC 74030 / MF5533) TaxID=1104152 RepID=H0EFQ9_GLAL7|nr:hypothetical protein M7I_1315 [Glarea lozoyensis 74030]